MVGAVNGNQDYEKPGMGRLACGILAGGAVADIASFQGPLTQKLVCPVVQRKFGKLPKNAEFSKALVDAFSREDVKATGVKLVDYTKATFVPEKIPESANFLQKMFMKQQAKMQELIIKGKNAFFVPFLNQIHMNAEKMGLLGFHEIGHAMNFHNSKIWRTIQKSRPLATTLIPFALLLTALIKSKKAEGEKAEGFWDKTTTFIKENVGKLTTLTFVPLIAEEIKATLNGQKIAKGMLSPENYKNVVKGNRIGALSYVAGAIIAGTGAYLANKIRDAIVKPASKPNQNNVQQ